MAPLVAASAEPQKPETKDRGGSRVTAELVNPTAREPGAFHPRAPRLREGSELVDQLGHFEPAGERLVFVAAPPGVRLVALENLNLERIWRAMAGSPGRLDWLVSGTVTEYRGTRYFLVERAVVTTGTQPGAK